jgi:hypothetical protein
MLERDIDKEAIIMQQALRLNAPLPDKIANMPDLNLGLDFYMEVYLDLCSDKDVGFGEGPIPWSSMDNYAKRYDIVGYEFERMVMILRSADGEILKGKQKTADRKKGKK